MTPVPFSHRVLSVVRRIPPGRVATYGDIARLAGRPRAARAVGNIMRGCRRPDIPCHRVIAAGGRPRGGGGGARRRRGRPRRPRRPRPPPPPPPAPPPPRGDPPHPPPLPPA